MRKRRSLEDKIGETYMKEMAWNQGFSEGYMQGLAWAKALYKGGEFPKERRRSRFSRYLKHLERQFKREKG